jgi:hypothetical protein
MPLAAPAARDSDVVTPRSTAIDGDAGARPGGDDEAVVTTPMPLRSVFPLTIDIQGFGCSS